MQKIGFCARECERVSFEQGVYNFTCSYFYHCVYFGFCGFGISVYFYVYVCTFPLGINTVLSYLMLIWYVAKNMWMDLNISPICVILKPCALICCCKSLQSSRKAFHQILEPGCRDFHSFSHKRMIEVEYWCSLSVGVPVHPKGVAWGLRSRLCAGQSSSSTTNWKKKFFMDLAVRTVSLSCWNRKGCRFGVRSVCIMKYEFTHWQRIKGTTEACSSLFFKYWLSRSYTDAVVKWWVLFVVVVLVTHLLNQSQSAALRSTPENIWNLDLVSPPEQCWYRFQEQQLHIILNLH